MLPLEIEKLIMRYRGNIQPPHFFIYDHYLKIKRLNEEIEEIDTYYQKEEDDMFNAWYCGGYMLYANFSRRGSWDIAGNFVE